ncbi:MAG: AraC family transcriptional regulator [Clostridia bacterium]|nr:AraC family transcriptional regulator [Clostridia bacterium]
MVDSLETRFGTKPALISTDLKSSYGVQKSYAVHTYSDRIELLWILEGTGKYICNGIIYPVRPGDAVVCNSGTAHGMEAESQGILNYIQIFAHSVQACGMPDNCLVPIGHCPVIHRVRQRDRLEELFFEILAEERLQKTETGALLELVVQMYEIIQDQLPAMPLNIGWRAVMYIDSHYTETALTTEAIAEAMEVNRYNLAKVFKQMTGYSLLQYLTRRRIGAAQSMLLQTDTAIEDIAEKAGFCNMKRFSNAFRKQTGILPQDYRNIWKEM